MPDKTNSEDETSQGDQTQDFEKMYKDSSAEGHKRYEQTKKVSLMAVKANPKNLIELHKEDPKLAESIAKSEYDMSFDDAKEKIEGFSPSGDGTNEDALVDKIYSKIKAKGESEKASEVVDGFYSKNNIDGEFKTDFDLVYNDLVEGKKLTSDNAKKFLDIAFREVKQTSKHLAEHEKALKDAKSGGLTSGKGDGGKTPRKQGMQILGQSNKPDSWY